VSISCPSTSSVLGVSGISLKTMEGLTLSERYLPSSRCYSQQPPYRYWSPRLPTPEPSRSSNEAFQIFVNAEVPRRAPVHDLLSRSSPQGRDTSFRDSSDPHSSRRHGPAPHSPPYQTTDFQKPSLPPLKTVSKISDILVSASLTRLGTGRQHF